MEALIDRLCCLPFGSRVAWNICPVGSRVTCDPAPTDTDEDFLAHVFNHDRFAEKMAAEGFTTEGKPGFYTGNNNGGFISYRKGAVNIIATEEEEFFNLFMTATELAKRFNLLEKADRIALFQAILYGVKADNLEAA